MSNSNRSFGRVFSLTERENILISVQHKYVTRILSGVKRVGQRAKKAAPRSAGNLCLDLQ